MYIAINNKYYSIAFDKQYYRVLDNIIADYDCMNTDKIFNPQYTGAYEEDGEEYIAYSTASI